MADQQRDPSSPGFVPVCAIGASAGGVGVLQTLFRLLPDDLGLAYVVVVHLSPDHPSAMHEIIGACTRMPVFQVRDGPRLQANSVYVIAPDSELVIEGDDVKSRPFSDPRGRRAPIDMFFRSIAAARGDGIAVVLTGSGADGAVGVRAVKEAGGIVMVQEPAEAGFPSMPQNAIATGVADVVAPVARLAERIAEAARSKEAVRSLDEDGAAHGLRRIVAFLRTRTGHDFSGYKRATVLRRVMRRMQICRIDALDEYAGHLRSAPEEAKALFSDLLISVTMFFRDPAAFRALASQVVRPLLERAVDDEGDGEVRAWVVGCATGEEAYSLAILLLEEADRLKLHVPAQIFATDLDEGALATAREGRYPRAIEADVSPERLKRFFVDEGTHYRIHRRVRDLVLFATHSVVREPPFMRLDLVTCRNVLIYLERSLQQHVCAIFHYGLKPGGALFLGTAETADMVQDQFAAVDREARIYRARGLGGVPIPVLAPAVPMSLGRSFMALEGRAASPRFEAGETLGASHAAALEASAPPSALVDADHAVLHLSPSAGRFILLSAGPLSGRLPSIVRPELRLDLKMALDRAFDTRQPTVTRLIDLRLDGAMRRVSVHVAPVPSGEGAAARATAFFLDHGPSLAAGAPEDLPASDELRQLHGELKAAQEAALAGRLGHEAALQELRASNEELQSLNEEYRSTAEELETSKEELQSINEELQTVNAELKTKLSAISAAHDDLQNLTASSEIGTLFLDTALRIRMFTPRVAELINITGADIGRPVTDFTHRLAYAGLEEDVRRVLRDLRPIETQVRGQGGRWFTLRVRPYRTLDDRIEGAVVTFDDVTERRRSEEALRDSETRFRAFVTASSDVVYRMSPNWTVMQQLDGSGFLADTPVPSGNWLVSYIPADERERVTASVDAAIQEKRIFELEHRVVRADGTVGWTMSRAVPILDGAGDIVEWLGSAKDVTDRKRGESALRESEERLRTLLEGIPQAVWRATHTGAWTWTSPQWHAYTGLSEAESLGHGWLVALHPDDRGRTESAWALNAGGGPLDMETRIRHAGTDRYRWFQSRALPVRDASGAVMEWLGTSTDVQDLKALQEGQAVLVAELQHRTRNLIAAVRGIADDTLDETGPTEAFRDVFSDRLEALSRVQGLLSRSEAEPITIGALVRLELDALAAGPARGRVALGGPDVYLRPSTVQTLALALHELATNARKYGALSRPDGRLSVTWRERDEGGEPRLALDWVESGLDGAAAADAPRAGGGYGRELIERALPHAMGARTSYALTATGLSCSLDIPARPGRGRDDP